MTSIKKLSSPQVEFGEYFTAVSANIIHQETRGANSVQNDANNSAVFLKDNAAYSQATYPDLYNRLGLIGAGVTTPITSGTAATIQKIVYGNGIYLYGASDGTVGTSTDGVTWTTRSVTTVTAIVDLDYGNGIFAFAANPQSVRYGTSTDGVTWTTQTSDSNPVVALTYGNGIFIVSKSLGGGTGASLQKSTDGLNYSTTGIATPSSSSPINSLFYASSGLWLCCNQDATQYVKSSTDNGASWSSSGTLGFGASTAKTFGYGNGLYVLVSTNATLYTSTNGTTWTSRTSGTASAINTVTYGNGLYVYGAASGTYVTSTDAITWNQALSVVGSITFSCSSYMNSKYYFGGGSGSITTSTTMTNVEYSPYYTAASQFYIPPLTESSTLTLQATTTLLSSAIYSTYIRAK
jgi:hypothetical protein